MKSNSLLLSALIGGLLAFNGAVANAQGEAVKADAPLTREQVKRERDEFIKTHRWDPVTDNWVLKAGVEAPTGMKTRAEVKAERDVFLRTHKYDSAGEVWVPLKSEPRNLSLRTREEVREETRQFMRTHRWDPVTDTYLEQMPSKKK
jgi:hypothetical protein